MDIRQRFFYSQACLKRKILKINPNERPTSAQILEDPWFDDLKNQWWFFYIKGLIYVEDYTGSYKEIGKTMTKMFDILKKFKKSIWVYIWSSIWVLL